MGTAGSFLLLLKDPGSNIDPELEENFNNIGESIYSHLVLTDASSEGPL